MIKPFVPNTPLLYTLKTSENITVLSLFFYYFIFLEIFQFELSNKRYL